jgi:hypothetical protein
MDKTEFLEKNIFQNLKNLNETNDDEAIRYFSEADFQIAIERIENLGIGIYKIEPRLEGVAIEAKVNEDYRKKATDPKWYKRAFFELKKNQPKLQYSATYRVSDRLLNRGSVAIDQSEEKAE